MIRTTKKNTGFFVSSNRQKKSKKIIKILEQETANSLADKTILDIGTGNGEIANHLSKIAQKVISIDIKDNRQNKEDYCFIICNENLPFNNQCIDIVISNHVIEHVSDNKLHLKEISRVLKDDGIIYLATPNRFWPWEVHYRLLFLHYLPDKLFINTLKLLNIYHEDLKLLSWVKLKNLLKNEYTMTNYCDKVARQPDQYFMSVNNSIVKILKLIPLKFYTILTFINPTLIVTLKKSNNKPG